MKETKRTPKILKYDMFCIVFLPIIQRILYKLISPENQTPNLVLNYIFAAINIVLLCMLLYFGRLTDKSTKKWMPAYILAGIVHIIYIFFNVKDAVC